MLRTVLLIPCIALVLVFAGAGCTTKRMSFPGRDSGQVWTALVAVAKTPDYNDPEPSRRWHVKENEVWVDEEIAVIEIYRELDRIRYPARMRPQRQQRTWRFRILFDDTDPPRATFVSRGLGVPMQAAGEGHRYFEDVWKLLETGYLGPSPLTIPAEPPPPIVDMPDPMDLEPPVPDEPAAVPEEPPVGSDLLDPGG